MIIRKKTLEKMLREAKQEVWDSVRKQDSERSIWDNMGRIRSETCKNRSLINSLTKRVAALEEAMNKGGKK